MEGFTFPLGVYPIEPMTPVPHAGYTVTFEPADGESEGGRGGKNNEADALGLGGSAEGDGGGEAGSGGLADLEDGGREGGGGDPGDWEEWPDRYVYDILVPASRVESLCRTLFALLPGRVFPILDILGQDEFREVDPYVSYDLIGLERFLDAVRRFNGFFYEDGLVGFGVIAEEPFLYIFVDEHKIVTVRVETAFRDKVEAVLSAFDLSEVEEIAGADAATHEHRGVLDSPEDRPDLLNAEEIIEYLRDEWRLVLNIDPETNLDDDGEELGRTGWRCIVRHDWEIPQAEADAAKAARKTGEKPKIGRYAEIMLTANCFRQAEDLALAEFKSQLPASLRKIWEQDDDAADVPILVAADRLTPEHFAEDVKTIGDGVGEGDAAAPTMDESRVWAANWMPLDPPSTDSVRED